MVMAHCPNCGKEVRLPSRVTNNYSFTIEAYNCKSCHHNFKIKINESAYLYNEANLVAAASS
jgi:transposase-like protein